VRSTQQFSITLPNEMADAVRAKVASGEYATESEVIRDGLRALLARDQAVERWLKDEVAAAYDALKELGLANLVAVGLAKREEVIVTRDRPAPIALAANHPSLLLLQRVRDEAHRFAVTFQRHARRQRDLRSGLDEIAGIGPRRRRALLETFGSVAGVRRASREALSAAVGAKAADAVLAHFAREC